ncbi:hypothetical protein [Teredinibacter turnerae]|uniref:hypothetical protein n=1 Tax=Teredinibacter turnerae TaxID=2426 RepID=UPI0003FA2B37|nr:hypothetical protein [Teredinibacter turnerae]
MLTVQDVISKSWFRQNAYRLKFCYTLWCDSSSPIVKNIPKTDHKSYLKARFGYGIPGESYLAVEAFDNDSVEPVVCERYGGSGLGSNFGGGRAANLNGYQLKGLGPTAMVGKYTEKLHSYGGLDAEKAVLEVVFSKVLNRVLPLGSVSCHGLLFTGRNTAIIGNARCWGVILIRDTCLRPGHLLPAEAFFPQDRFRSQLISEKWRLKHLFNQLSKLFSPEQFCAWLLNYLNSAALQFGFARSLRISNGTITASNIAIDGRWLDLPVCSFVSSGINHHIWSEFFNEHSLALQCGLDVAYFYQKYTGIQLNLHPFNEEYSRRFAEGFSRGIAFVLALEDHFDILEQSDSWTVVVDIFFSEIHKNNTISPYRPLPIFNDSVYRLIDAFYLSHHNGHAAQQILFELGLGEGSVKRFTISANRLQKYFCNLVCQNDSSSLLFLIGFRSIKRAHLSGIFFLSIIGDRVDHLCAHGQPDDIGIFIDQYCEAINWIYDDSTELVTLFKDANIQISVGSDERVYLAGDPTNFSLSEIQRLVTSIAPTHFLGLSLNYYWDSIVMLSAYYESKHESMKTQESKE